jgi:site-specific recombinase XerD
MATVQAFIRVSTRKTDSVKIRFRLSAGRGKQLFHVSEMEVNPVLWDNVKQEIKAKVVCTTEKRNEITTGVAARKSLILKIYNDAPEKFEHTSEWLEQEIDKRLHPEKYQKQPQTFFDIFNEFLDKRKLSDARKKNFRVLIRALRRYELYKQRITHKLFVLSFDTITGDTLRDIQIFLRDEYSIIDKYPDIYAMLPETRIPQKRGQNTLNGIFTKLRTFYLWAMDEGKSTFNPFKRFVVENDVYGDPIYISIAEREQLYRTNLSRHRQLAIQRDIFVFQCLIGCRVGDLYLMTKHNIINGAIEYIARKTKDGRPVTVRVPLNSTAKNILAKYTDCGERLLPFISQQKYNYAIKRAFLAARLRRSVTVINPTTREPEIRPLNEIASSHMARRCFVGNLYKKVKDPNLVGALSGHKEGSRAFARYRDIDEEMKTDLVKMLEND